MKLTPAKIKKYNKIAEKKPIMVRVGSKWYTWAEGDPKHGVFLTTQDGKDVEFDFNQIDDIKESVTRLTKAKLKEMIKVGIRREKNWLQKKHEDKVFNERVSMPFGEHLNSVIKELDYMISVGADDDVYDNPKQSVKLIKTARQLLGKVK
jgi:hypothetical protein